ncbi:acetyl-CoA hydrolase [Naumannella sp. ID2617S]|nr:acetyl-CoA hydrolase [Naumannella sp. ID2617S]
MRIVEEAALAARLGAVPDGSRVVATGNFATPRALMGIVDRAIETYRLCMLNAQPGIPDRAGVVHESSFVGPGMRRSDRLRYLPARLSMVPTLFAGPLPPEVVVLHVSRPRGSMVSMGIEVNILPAAIEACRQRGGLVIAQVNHRMPFIGGDALVPVDDIDLAIEVDEELATHAPGAIDDESAAIGAAVAAGVRDGTTLQTGIGAVPDAVLAALTERRGLRVWTEMFSDGVLALDRQGCLDQDHPLITSFLFGSAELYAWADGNPRVRMLRTEKTNDPALIALNRQMLSVNTALQVDLFGQANASRIKHRIYSGTGGQTDFIVGAMHAPGGRAVLALKSWHPKADVSTVVGHLTEATTSMQMSAVVTEQGTAELWGHTQTEQAANLIEHAAHPRARETLWDEAKNLGLA